MSDFTPANQIYGWDGVVQFWQTWADHITQLNTDLEGEANVNTDWDATSGAAQLLNKPDTITTAQAAAIIANTLKRTYPLADENKLATVEGGAIALTANEKAAITNSSSPSTSNVFATMADVGGDSGIPFVTTDPASPDTGDVWINTTDYGMKAKTATGTIIYSVQSFIAD